MYKSGGGSKRLEVLIPLGSSAPRQCPAQVRPDNRLTRIINPSLPLSILSFFGSSSPSQRFSTATYASLSILVYKRLGHPTKLLIFAFDPARKVRLSFSRGLLVMMVM